MIFKYLASLPWRKPIAIIYSIGTFFLIGGSWWFNKDIPDNAYHLLVTVDTVVLSWAYGTSTMEAIKNVKKE